MFQCEINDTVVLTYRMSDKPLVSVIVPTCNRSAQLLRCLDSLKKQTYPNFEIVVVDDGSTDDTAEQLEASSSRSGMNIKSLRNETRRGANPSRNRAIRVSGGEFLAFLDDDCIAAPDWLERIVAGFKSEKVAAVTGAVIDVDPANIYELTLKGHHRVHGAAHATRLVALNMCVRRDRLTDDMFDEDRAEVSNDLSVSGRGDEEGVYLRLKAGGYEQRVAHDAVVLHEHRHTGRTFFRQAFLGGRSAAKLVYKYHLLPRLDILPFLLAYASLPLSLLHPWMAWFAVFCFTGALVAIVYNDLFRKRKTVAETVKTFPVLLAYYHVRVAGYVLQVARLWAGLDKIRRVRLSLTNKS